MLRGNSFLSKEPFLLPSGKAGKDYITEMNRLVNYWNQDSVNLLDVSLKMLMCMCMPALLLQKPHKPSKSRDHTGALLRRHALWKSCDFEKLIRESREIQARLKSSMIKKSDYNLTMELTKHMLQGNIRSAIRLLENSTSKGILHLDMYVKNTLRNLYPGNQNRKSSVLMT